MAVLITDAKTGTGSTMIPGAAGWRDRGSRRSGFVTG